MKKFFMLFALLLFTAVAHAAVEVDTDANGGVDLDKGGTNAVTAAAARTNLGLAIGTDVQAYDADLADLADGSLSESAIDAAIARDSEVTLAPVTAPTTATDTCTAGTWAYDASYYYVCVATDTWVRAALATW